MSDPSLPISEIFSSIQGEGIWLGTPSTFIRVAGCNLRCGWCDTPYASWQPEGQLVSIESIVAEARVLAQKHVVVTGGEPLMFSQVADLVKELRRSGATITIETAGTVWQELDCDLMSISPKLRNSLPDQASGWRSRHNVRRLNLPVLTQLIEGYNFQLKFVLISEDDEHEIDELLKDLPRVDPERVLLMAEGVSPEVQRDRQTALVKLSMRRGWRITPRYHIDLFGNVRGT